MRTVRGKKSFFNFVNDVPLNSKFLMIYILCVLIPILTINVVYWNRISKDIKEREKENYNISINRVETDISHIMEGCVDISHSVSSDIIFYYTIERDFKSDSEYYEAYNELLRVRLNRQLSYYTSVKQISLYTSNNTIDIGGDYYFLDKTVKNSVWYTDMYKSNDKVVLDSYKVKDDYSSSGYTQFLSVIRKIDDFASTSNKYDHILKIDVNLNKIYEIFDREKDYLELLLIDPEGHVICSTGSKYESENRDGRYIDFSEVLKNANNSDYMIRKMGNANFLSGWNIVGIPNQNHIINESKQSNIIIISIIISVTMLSSVLIWIIVRSYNYRLKKLLKHMIGVEKQNFDLIEVAEGKDEIGELILSFNKMSSKINTLINDVYKLELKKKDLEIQRVQAELKYLQSQVDPHFLFNTLNAVMAICVRNNYSELTEVIKYLSKIFRRLISWKEDLVPIREEISFTEMYLKIEKFRFLEKFDYEIEVDEKTLELKVPKMSIQTIVENACKHGIQNTAGVGVVRIKVSLKEEFLHVEVEDNGAGIDEYKLSEIYDSLLAEDNLCENIGVRNVYKRLHLFYGDEVEFDIKSEINNGTVVHYGISTNAVNIGDKHSVEVD